MNRKLLVVILISVGLILAGGVTVAVGYYGLDGKEDITDLYNVGAVNPEDIISKENIVLDSFDTISVSHDYGDFSVIYGEDYNITLRNYTKETMPQYKVNGTSLEIITPEVETSLFNGVHLGNIKGEIIVTVPKDTTFQEIVVSSGAAVTLEQITCDNLELSNNYGGVALSSITAKTITLDVDSDTQLKDITADTIDIVNDYGISTMENIKSTDFIFEGSSGKLAITALECEKAEISNDYGDCSLAEITATTLTMDSSDGSGSYQNITADTASYKSGNGAMKFYGGTYKNLTIDGSYGTITFKDTVAETMKTVNDSGAISGENVYFSNMNVQSMDGHIEFDGGEMKNIVMDSDYGHITLKGKLLGTISLDVESGEVTMEIAGEEESYAYDMKTEYGNITIDDSTYEGSVVSRTKADNNIKVDSSDGNISLKFIP